jgi:hypothetical protein
MADADTTAQPEPEPPTGPDSSAPSTPRSPWSRLRKSVYVPAVVLVFILAAAAGLFASSYCVAMANPTPHRIPVGVLGTSPRGPELIAAMEKGLKTSLDVHSFANPAAALQAVNQQSVFAVLDLHGNRATLDVVGAAGASVARVLTAAGPQAGATVGVPVTVADVKPLRSTDPQGLAIFYISLAAVVVGFVGSIQLSVHAKELNPGERIAFTLAYAVLGGFTIAAVVDWGLGVLALPFLESWGILSLTMFTTGMVFTMFNTLVGRWAMIPTWGLMVLLGNPSSGGAVSWPLLPRPLGMIGRWLPPGASVNAQHTAIYFRQYQYAFPFLVLAGWLIVAVAVFWIWQERHPGGRPTKASAPGS